VKARKLTVKLDGRRSGWSMPKGRQIVLTIADVNQSNGVIHVVDTVLMTKS